jgi:cell division protein FtsW
MVNKVLNNMFKGDKVIWMVFFFLCIISVVEVYSASSQLTYKAGNYLGPITKHAFLLLVGGACTVTISYIPCRYFKTLTPFALGFAILSLYVVLAIGASTNGAQRWISLGPIQFQPSEIAKGAMVLTTAQILSALQTDHGADKNAFKYILVVSLFLIPPILKENFSTAALLSAVIFMMMFIGRVPMRQLGKLLTVGAIVVLLFISTIMVLGHDHEVPNKKMSLTETSAEQPGSEQKGGSGVKGLPRLDTWKSRINKFLSNEEVSPKDIDLDKDAQVAHANIAIASSNVVGKGFGNSEERDFMSQAYSDFIYAVIIEEMGVEGAFGVALLYIILLFRTGRIANRCENSFPALLAMGLALLLVTQAIFNMMVAVGLVPVTGQPLPLISRGGTSSIINCAYIGVILSVSRSAKKKNDEPQPVAEPVAATAE